MINLKKETPTTAKTQRFNLQKSTMPEYKKKPKTLIGKTLSLLRQFNETLTNPKDYTVLPSNFKGH